MVCKICGKEQKEKKLLGTSCSPEELKEIQNLRTDVQLLDSTLKDETTGKALLDVALKQKIETTKKEQAWWNKSYQAYNIPEESYVDLKSGEFFTLKEKEVKENLEQINETKNK